MPRWHRNSPTSRRPKLGDADRTALLAPGSGGGGGFTPASSAIHWWDSSDESTITHTLGAVSAFDDKVGLGNYNQALGTVTTGTRTVNGLNVIDLGRGRLQYGGYFTSSEVASLGLFSIYGVFVIDTIAHLQFLLTSDNRPSSRIGQQLRVTTGGVLDCYIATNSYTGAYFLSSTALSPPIGTPFAVHCGFDGTKVEWQLGAATETQATSGTNWALQSAADPRVGLGGDVDNSSDGDGAICEVFCEDEPWGLGTDEHNERMTYLSDKWGAPL